MFKSTKQYLKHIFNFYKENLAILSLIVLADLAIYSLQFIPYVNWFAGLIPYAISVLTWFVLIVLFRLSPLFIYKFSIFLLFLTFLMTLVGASKVAVFMGIIIFGMIGTVIIQKMLEVKKTNVHES